MKYLVGIALLLGGMSAQANPDPFYISCFRGPLKVVAWDHPNPEFVDSLFEYGYSIATATAIGERVCSDPNLVGEPELMEETLLQLLKEVPRDGNK